MQSISVAELNDYVSREVLCSSEAARYLGISRSYLDKLCHRRKIPYSRPGGKLRFFRIDDLRAWAQQNRVATVEEINGRAMSRTMKEDKK